MFCSFRTEYYTWNFPSQSRSPHEWDGESCSGPPEEQRGPHFSSQRLIPPTVDWTTPLLSSLFFSFFLHEMETYVYLCQETIPPLGKSKPNYDIIYSYSKTLPSSLVQRDATSHEITPGLYRTLSSGNPLEDEKLECPQNAGGPNKLMKFATYLYLEVL